MIEKVRQRLDEIVSQYEDLMSEMSKPEVYSDSKKLSSLSKKLKDVESIVNIYNDYKKVEREIEEYKAIIDSNEDEELVQIARQSLDEARERQSQLEEDLRLALVPKDPYDERNVIIEIRAGTGGDEASLFAGEIFRMYEHYATEKGYKIHILSAHETSVGGYKEIIFSVEGYGAYSRLKHESGVHRVQRVPITESGGRLHTSAITVAVLPEAEEVEINISPDDLEIDVFRASGPGGQHVNVTDSAVRITHKPTGIVVSCQDERSQHQNRAKALQILMARLLDLKKREQEERIARERKEQIKTGDRSERIRTYNYPQNRITDHRINLTLYSLTTILEGDLDPLIEPLMAEEKKRRLISAFK
ncbi:MAG: peptide chain release factor 1 [bacterium]